MQKINFNKLVDLNHELKELQSISVNESIHYKLEENGMRALGNIMINGEYKDQSNIRKFEDSVELDIYANNEKITDRRDFLVKVDDFDYSINDGNLNLTIQASVHGVIDDKSRTVETSNSIDEIENLIREIDSHNGSTAVQEVNENDNEEVDDLGIYYFYIIKENDTYSSISDYYNVNEDDLRSYNHNKELIKGNIIIVPYLL